MIKTSLPITGNIVGAVVGLLAGTGLVVYLSVMTWLDMFCLVGACILTGQFIGTAVGSILSR